MQRPELFKYRPYALSSAAWYRVTNRAEARVSVYIMDEIGSFGVSADAFVRDLATLEADTLEVHINSPGGSAFDGVAIYNALRDHPAKVETMVDGLAASAASFIAQAGDTRFMAASASMMIHPAQGFAAGDAEEMRKTADMLQKVSDSIAGIYAERSGRDKEDFDTLMAAETWFTAAEAVEAGLIDKVGSPANPKPGRSTKDDPEDADDGDDTDDDEAEMVRDALQRAFA
jgi:ATP-dependent Clp endopeptidase proteolytic subunit ClpP